MSIRRSNLEQDYVRALERAYPMKKPNQEFIDLASNDALADETLKLGAVLAKRRDHRFVPSVDDHPTCEICGWLH